jgi:hypothetical protein
MPSITYRRCNVVARKALLRVKRGVVGIDGGTTPSDLEGFDIVGADLAERGVFAAADIRRVGRPVAALRHRALGYQECFFEFLRARRGLCGASDV